MTKKKISPYTWNFDYTWNSWVSGALNYKWTFQPSGGVYPTWAVKWDFYIASDAWTVSGIEYWVWDWAVYNWVGRDKIDNTETNKVKYDAWDPTAGYVADKFVAWTGISVAEWTGLDENKLKITNSAPDQTVAISAWTNITSVTWTYPNFTINAATQTTDISWKLDKSVATDTYFTTWILDRTKSNISFDNTSHVFTISPTVTTFDIYLSWVKYSKWVCSVDLDTVWLVTNTMYFIYFDSNWDLQWSTTPWNILSNNAPVATIYWNWSTWRLQDERHNANRNLSWHEWAHETIGMRYESWLAWSFASGSFSIAEWYVDDEDIEFYIPQQTSTMIRYRASWWAKMTFDDTPSTVDAKIVWWALKYDLNWTLTDVSSGYYMRTWTYATNDKDNPIYTIIWQQEYANLNDARAPLSLTLPNFPTNEMRLLSRCIRQNLWWTPTLIECADYRTAPQTPWWVVATIPTFLNDLEDVYTPNPSLDNFLKYNWTQWVAWNVPTWWGSWVDYFHDSTSIIASSAENPFAIETLSTVPSTWAQTVESVALTNNTLPIDAYLSSALWRTSIPTGTWEFDLYASVSSTAWGRVSTITRNIFQVVPWAWTVTITWTGTSRTCTASTWTPFVSWDANANQLLSWWVQTPKWLYQITWFTSSTVVTIATPAAYTNESTVAFSTWKRLFWVTSDAITATGTNYTRYVKQSFQSAFIVATTDKIWTVAFATSNNTTTVNFVYQWATTQSHFTAPITVLHNDLAWLQWWSAWEYNHITNAQLTVLGNTSWTNTWDQDLSWYLLKSTYDAQTILQATTDNTPTALTVWEQTVVGRATWWNISALAIDSDLSSVSANDDTIPSAKATKSALDTKLPLAWWTMTGNILLWENTSIDNDPSLSADWKYTWICITWTAWATLAFWDLIYLDPTDSRRELADANIAAWSDWDARWILWICVLAAANDWDATKILLHWVVRADMAFPTLTINAQAYVSETAWDITNTAPTTSWAIVRVVWWWLTADALYFNPSSDWIEV